ncbi:hypothetical protein IEQ34_007219 [Dendrobium chrysotoxum]|uniref:Uncharacterized protein n=1 Tax=Dendrobium chrysotoxum TaxID=161865 RepID=A0AAV7HAA3_DENCH|nr:hypothetical protein IEQ34_007219 [Dendrobium chrysotoxum]
MDDEDPLLYEDVESNDEWFVDDEVEVMPSELQDEDLNVDFFDGLKASTSTTTQEQIKKGKRKITDIEEGADWETLDSIGEEEEERAVHHNDDSNEDPLSLSQKRLLRAASESFEANSDEPRHPDAPGPGFASGRIRTPHVIIFP